MTKSKKFTPTAEQLTAVAEQAKLTLDILDVDSLKTGKTLYKVIVENDVGLFLDDSKEINSYFDSLRNQEILNEDKKLIALRDSMFNGFKVVRKTADLLVVDYVYSVSEYEPVEKVVLHKDGTTSKKTVKGELIEDGYDKSEICDCIKWTLSGDKGVKALGYLYQENRKTKIKAQFCTASSYKAYQNTVNNLIAELSKAEQVEQLDENGKECEGATE